MPTQGSSKLPHNNHFDHGGQTNHGDTSGQAMPKQGGSILPHHNHFDHGGQTNYGLYANLQYQASEAAGLDNTAHAVGVPTEWPQNHSTAPIHVNMPTQGSEGQEMSLEGSILPHHNNFDYGGQTNYGLASEAAGLENAAQAVGASTEWPQNHSPAHIHVNFIMNSTVIQNFGPPAHAYHLTQ